jgi:hypothetical protein
MSCAVLIERQVESSKPAQIEIGEWIEIVNADPQLRIRAEPYLARHPVTASLLVIPVGEADAEIYFDGQWLPFLRFRRGKLITEYQSEFETPGNELRMKIAHIARQLGAVVISDTGGDDLEWS